ncbi:MAG: 4'-phosphopantetheinyl transferase superfamily protein [Rikenellaceae bacterium]
MALHKHYCISSDINVYLWEITETIEELISLGNLDKDETEVVLGFKSQNRQKEWCAVRALLQSVKKGSKIGYNSFGAPYIIDEKQFISISHTGKFVAISLSNKKSTIDIELKNRNFQKVSHKYVNKEEEVLISSSEIEPNLILAIIWSFKEAVFKYAEHGEIDFKADIQIINFANGRINFLFRKKPSSGVYIIENEYVLTITE